MCGVIVFNLINFVFIIYNTYEVIRDDGDTFECKIQNIISSHLDFKVHED